MATGKNKKVKSDIPKPAADTVMINVEGGACYEWASLHRRQWTSSIQQTARFIELDTPTKDDFQAL